jgi:hypothetical protein
VLSQIPQRRLSWQRPAGQLLHCLRQQDLPPMADGQQSRQAVEGCGQVVAVGIWFRFPGMQRHAHLYRSRRIGPGFRQERALGGDRGSQRVFSGGKGSLGAIADGLVQHPMMGFDEALEDGQVSVHSHPHRGAVMLPHERRAFDVGEQKGDCTAGSSSISALSSTVTSRHSRHDGGRQSINTANNNGRMEKRRLPSAKLSVRCSSVAAAHVHTR